MTRLDEVMPAWQFRERHSIAVEASPERVFDAIRTVRAEDIFLFRTLVAIRRGFRAGEESILNPPKGEPILDVATRTGFHYIVTDPPREVILGISVASGTEAVMNFEFAGGILSTETRVHARTRRAKWRFALYWFAISAGSGFIRRMWLRAIRKRAEA